MLEIPAWALVSLLIFVNCLSLRLVGVHYLIWPEKTLDRLLSIFNLDVVAWVRRFHDALLLSCLFNHDLTYSLSLIRYLEFH